MHSTIIFLTNLVVILAMMPTPSSALRIAETDFEKQIFPLLKQFCFDCHDGKKQKAGFRLDIKSRAMAGGESGKVGIKPGDAAGSELFRRIVSSDSEVVMPPRKEKLNKEQQALFKQWIDAGAHWPEHVAGENKKPVHWAYIPPKRPELPAVNLIGWVRNHVDTFVLARLDKEGLKPSPEADKITLLRRLHLDLIGLPPTIQEVDAYLSDTSKDAYVKVVEKLLASPHYGERWGRHWLDAARYADSDGYEKDKSRQMWFYRDWVVSAFNRDLPYDQFIRDQIAGDLLPQATQDQIVATGFLRNSMLNEEGGVDPEQFRMDAMFDRMDAIGKSILGITIQCAQCHNHKYDPITQEEYYKLFAFLNNDHEAQRVVYTPVEMIKINSLQQQMKKIEIGLQERTPDWKTQLEAWENEVRKKQVKWTILNKLENAGDNGQRYIPQSDGSILAQGYAPTKFDTHLRGPSQSTTINAFRIEMLNDPNLPCNGPGRSQMGTFALSEFKVKVESRLQSESKEKKSTSTWIKFNKASADYSNPTRDLEATYDDRSNKKRITGSIHFTIDGKNDTAWGIDQGPGRRNQSRVAVFAPEKPITLDDGALIDVYLTQQHGGWNSDDHMNNNLGRFRLSVTNQDHADEVVIPPHIEEIFKKPAERRSQAQTALLFSYWRSTVQAWKVENEQIERLWEQWPAGSTSLTVQAREQPRVTRVLKRGEFMKPDRLVQAAVPAAFNGVPKNAKPDRLTLARWLTDRQAPTTARVFVNRVWQEYFGHGIVGSAEDFGVQSEQPTHPELLDWLAVEFMDNSWSIKSLHRLIVNSATYRQSSKVTPELLNKDPYNRLLARASRLRVEAEIVRDISLAVSGLMNPQVGGPSLFSPAPLFLFQPPASYGPFTWSETQGPDRYRRALYTFRRRSTPYPMLSNFDAPNGDAACVRRSRSNTPLQALTTLNEVVFVEAARSLGKRMLIEGGKTDQDRIRYGFRQCTSRLPSDTEIKLLETHLHLQRARLAEGWLHPAEIIGTRDLKEAVPAGLTPTQWASYTLLARVLLNLDETITRE